MPYPPFNLNHGVDLSSWDGVSPSAEFMAVLDRTGILLGRSSALSVWYSIRSSKELQLISDFAAKYSSDPLFVYARNIEQSLEIDEINRKFSSKYGSSMIEASGSKWRELEGELNKKIGLLERLVGDLKSDNVRLESSNGMAIERCKKFARRLRSLRADYRLLYRTYRENEERIVEKSTSTVEADLCKETIPGAIDDCDLANGGLSTSSSDPTGRDGGSMMGFVVDNRRDDSPFMTGVFIGLGVIFVVVVASLVVKF